MLVRKPMQRVPRGFTLVEVLVAVGVVALALPAMLMALHERIDASAHLRDRSLAQWVAANELAELRIAAERGQDWRALEAEGVEEMAGRRWRWQVNRQETAVPSFYRVEITVGREEIPDEVLETLTAFLVAESPHAVQ